MTILSRMFYGAAIKDTRALNLMLDQPAQQLRQNDQSGSDLSVDRTAKNFPFVHRMARQREPPPPSRRRFGPHHGVITITGIAEYAKSSSRALNRYNVPANY